ncbi:MAG: hypothetical protein IKT46_01710 [Clostridia bacterium]|nr:hypothetical protein [Clostridia bacterium]
MSEKYKVIYSQGENLYAERSPVIIRRAVLLRDIRAGSMLCKMHLINLTDKTIKRLKVSVKTDVGNAEGMTDDVCIIRDSDITVDIPLEGFEHKKASFKIEEILFTDSSSWSENEGMNWSQLSFPETIEDYLSSPDLVREFKSHFEEGVYFPKEEKDLWFCTCGNLNHISEAACHFCNRTLVSFKKYGVDELKNAVIKQKRLDVINKDKFDEAYKQVMVDKKSKRGRTFLYILIAAAIITVIALLIAVDGTHYTQAI